MRVLVTGSNGQVGYCLKNKLSKINNVVLLALTRDDLDITNKSHLNERVIAFKPDVIINAAAYTAVDQAENDVEKSYLVNRDAAGFLAQVAQQVDAAILHISTDYVYEGDKEGEYDETDPTNPQTIYGKSKLAGELAVQHSCSKHIILRTAWVFGEHGNNFVKTMYSLASSRDSLNIVADQYGGPTYAGDIAAVLIVIARKVVSGDTINYGVYNFSGMPYVNWYEFAKVILKTAKHKKIIDKIPKLTPISTEQYPTLAKRPNNSKLKMDKILREFSIDASDWSASLKYIQG